MSDTSPSTSVYSENGAWIENDVSGRTDYYNLHTYDFYDYFIIIFCLSFFGFVCCIIGCLCNHRLMKSKYIHIDEINDACNRQNNYQNSKRCEIKSQSPSNNKYGNKSYGNKSYSNKSYSMNKSNSSIKLQNIKEEQQQLSPKILSVNDGYNEEDGTIEIAVDLDLYDS